MKLNMRDALTGAFTDPVDARQCAEIQRAMNDELAGKDARVRVRNDSDNECVVADARYPNGLRDTISVSWDECTGVEPEETDEPTIEMPDTVADQIDESEYSAVLEHAGKSVKQWNNLSAAKKLEYAEAYIESDSQEELDV